MKMSCLPVSLFPLMQDGRITIAQYAALCRELGLDGFDLGIVVLKNHTPKYLQRLNEDIAKEDIPLVMLTTYPDFTHPDPVQRRREYDFLVHDIALASALKAKFLRVTAGQMHPGINIKRSIDQAVENLIKVAAVADTYGVELVYENHSTAGGWHFMDISNKPDTFLIIAEQIRHTSIAINFDIANVLVAGEENTIEVLDKVFPKVKTIHVADMSVKGKMDPVQLGTGIVPIGEIFNYLKSRNYQGWLCLEVWKDDGIDAIKKAVHFVKDLWEKP